MSVTDPKLASQPDDEAIVVPHAGPAAVDPSTKGPIWRLVTGLLSLALFVYPIYAGLFGGPPAIVFMSTYLLIVMA